ncbi:hypothetical protein PSEUBRA_003952 [Kalmanozyma brasiliensis GHG001]|uniref:Uncharacterized protein n=1 Tax=Kalmanozyma brasiliensis (strain GHG001) TaxID=1365824 RepID=V5GJH0_KALBG|nr:uncharacterized protein PSEUBRA_003952 [Kalmanozyma brasiliensis GHG001]EST06092.1 hypothetical protein PSEUBRA_003952 [Kalmanozyma brasiliensis GHG001]
MRGILVYLLALAIMSLCARTSPIPPRQSVRQQSTAHHSPITPSSLLKRQSQPASTAVKAIENAALEAPKDWKRPLVIMLSGIGIASTIGWNYVSLRSFLNNQAKYRKQKERMEAEKSKPLPKVGDTLCAFATYTTLDEVQRRKPKVVKRPCYVLGAREESQPRDGFAAGHSVYGEASSAAAAPDLPTGPSRLDGLTMGGRMKKRGLAPASAEGLEEIAAEATHDLHPPTAPPISHWHSPPAPVPDEERDRLISSMPQSAAFTRRPSTLSPRPGFPRAHIEMTSPSSHDPPTEAIENDTPEEKVAGESSKKPLKWLKGKKISTEDLTFGVTVLNTIGTVPSLVLNTLNAYWYRGNPRTD